MMKILLLEDDRILSDSLKELLETEGYEVDTAYRGESVFDLTFDTRYDLYIFDINVPEINGFDILTALREADDTTPAIYITALTDINSISRGFKAGADDYIKKPFDPEELLIRIKNKYEPKERYIRVSEEIEYDPENKTVYKNKKMVGLGEVQLRLFDTLMQERNKIVDTYTLMGVLEQPSINALRVNLAKLKNKLGIRIKNIRGQGYMIETV